MNLLQSKPFPEPPWTGTLNFLRVHYSLSTRRQCHCNTLLMDGNSFTIPLLQHTNILMNNVRFTHIKTSEQSIFDCRPWGKNRGQQLLRVLFPVTAWIMTYLCNKMVSFWPTSCKTQVYSPYHSLLRYNILLTRIIYRAQANWYVFKDYWTLSNSW